MATAVISSAFSGNRDVLAIDALERRRRRDEELVAKVRSGDSAAFDDLVKPHLTTVRNLVKSIVENECDAQEVLQDALICAFSRLHQLRSSRFFRAWLMQIAVNHARMKLRGWWNRARMESLDVLLDDYDHESSQARIQVVDHRQSAWGHVESREIGSRIAQALEKLPRPCRDVFVLREIQELSMAETAAALGMSIAMVKTNLHRARKRLQRILAPLFRVEGSNGNGPARYSRRSKTAGGRNVRRKTPSAEGCTIQ